VFLNASSCDPDVKCPYCGNGFDIEISYEECRCSVESDTRCPDCNKFFRVTSDPVTFTVNKASNSSD